MSQSASQNNHAPSSIDRRDFLAGAAAAAAGVLVVQPSQAAAAAANSKITLGLIGCGGHGKWIAKLFQQHGGYRFVATADYFPDRAGRRPPCWKCPKVVPSADSPPISASWTRGRMPS